MKHLYGNIDDETAYCGARAEKDAHGMVPVFATRTYHMETEANDAAYGERHPSTAKALAWFLVRCECGDCIEEVLLVHGIRGG